MKCVVGNVNLGVWCRAIHCLTQVGDGDVFFDFSDTILTISTANKSHSTFATFLFFKPFFTSYRMTSEEPEKVTIPARNILKPYKTQKVAKSYLQSEIIYDPSRDFVTVTSEGRSHATTTYKLGASANTDDIMIECDPYSFGNCIKSDAKTLSSCLSNFSHVKGLAELTLKIDGGRVTLRNCVTDIARKDSVVTEYNLTSHDFSEFDVQEENVEFAFGFKEFKVFTTLAEQLKLPVHIHFQEGEEPIVVVIVKTDTFESRLCLAAKPKDPFVDSGPPPSATPLSANGRISNVTSQGSSAPDSRSIELNRRQENSASDAPEAPLDTSAHEPQAKRSRRTEVPMEPVMDSEEPEVPESEVPDLADIQIVQMVEQMEKRKASAAYRTFHRVMNTPRLSESEYLKTLPGHDILLCPESDDEGEGS